MFFVMCVVIYGNKNNLCTVLFSISDWSSPLCCSSFMMCLCYSAQMTKMQLSLGMSGLLCVHLILFYSTRDEFHDQAKASVKDLTSEALSQAQMLQCSEVHHLTVRQHRLPCFTSTGGRSCQRARSRTARTGVRFPSKSSVTVGDCLTRLTQQHARKYCKQHFP